MRYIKIIPPNLIHNVSLDIYLYIKCWVYYMNGINHYKDKDDLY